MISTILRAGLFGAWVRRRLGSGARRPSAARRPRGRLGVARRRPADRACRALGLASESVMEVPLLRRRRVRIDRRLVDPVAAERAVEADQRAVTVGARRRSATAAPKAGRARYRARRACPNSRCRSARAPAARRLRGRRRGAAASARLPPRSAARPARPRCRGTRSARSARRRRAPVRGARASAPSPPRARRRCRSARRARRRTTRSAPRSRTGRRARLLARPSTLVSEMRGKYCARTAPIIALLATRFCSAWRMSGRRASSSDGRPPGTAGKAIVSSVAGRSIGPGLRPSSTDSAASCSAIWRRSSGAWRAWFRIRPGSGPSRSPRSRRRAAGPRTARRIACGRPRFPR